MLLVAAKVAVSAARNAAAKKDFFSIKYLSVRQANNYVNILRFFLILLYHAYGYLSRGNFVMSQDMRYY